MSKIEMQYSLRLVPQSVPDRQAIKPRFLYFTAKRAFDVVVTLLAAPFALAIVGICVVLIRSDGGKAFYRQPRVGKGGRLFHLWKLRTMAPDAEKRLQTYLAADPVAKAEWETMQKLRNDPRITRLGKCLRKYSIDEIPQLYNVLVGDMSLVGPRPMLPEQRQHYPGTAYFDMRPGLTGLWQISERNGCTFTERALHDTRYSGIMSFSTDLWILMRTPAVVLKGTGL
ncbi:sugar transferase [Rhizobium giardinii]|uniref:Lipopolysaccharide/colanic/teichoic acid biosynthesis glycosyltransferase n=1 Tax=Rhizobium giardinii TaxID=56731 RepID=A0A7W8UEI6_9HYPH|nr:sugar transferase [Rhizobium giardinii]MBB5537926.1 lipopolysaccharide/colanic/teichoic acid biosynthesis glycosyltransferase [Rhizobium giardinii]